MYQAEEIPETPIPPYEHHEPTRNEEPQKVLAQEKGEHSKLLTKKTLTPSEVIDSLGFGWAQGINFLIISFGFVSLWSTVQLIPYLSTRLYVEFDLTPELESTLSVASFSGFAISHPLAGYVADRIGRKPAILLTSCWLAFWSFMCCSAQNITQLILYRCFFSLAGGNSICSFILIIFRDFLKNVHIYIYIYIYDSLFYKSISPKIKQINNVIKPISICY